MLNKELRLPLFNRRKTPRLFLVPFVEQLPYLSGVQLLWQNKKISPIYDMSSSGLVVSSQGILSNSKVGQTFEARVRFDPSYGLDDQKVELRLLKFTAQALYLSMDSLSSKGRLSLSPQSKDELILRNFHNITPWISQLQRFPFRVWWHGPFDTNLFIENIENNFKEGVNRSLKESVNGSINENLKQTAAKVPLNQCVRFEFEDLLALWMNQKMEFKKSQSVEEDVKTYWSSVLLSSSHRVFPGQSWKSRSNHLIQSLSLPLEDKDYVLSALNQSLDV